MRRNAVTGGSGKLVALALRHRNCEFKVNSRHQCSDQKTQQNSHSSEATNEEDSTLLKPVSKETQRGEMHTRAHPSKIRDNLPMIDVQWMLRRGWEEVHKTGQKNGDSSDYLLVREYPCGLFQSTTPLNVEPTTVRIEAFPVGSVQDIGGQKTTAVCKDCPDEDNVGA